MSERRYAGESAAVPQEVFTETHLNRLHEINGKLRDRVKTLHGIADNFLGVIPQDPNKTVDKIGPSHFTARATEITESLERALEDLEVEIDRLHRL